MGEFKSALKPYNLHAALAADHGSDCIVIDVGRDEIGQAMPSLQRVIDQVKYCIHQAHEPLFGATKLYIISEWNLSSSSTGIAANSGKEGKDIEAFAKRKDGVAKWTKATNKVVELLKLMGNLQELTWISGLPFAAPIWDELPTSLTKLVLDIGEPVYPDQDGEILHRSYITSNEMKPLQDQTQLEELRLFRVHNTFQPIIWETVFRNTSESGMRVLDVQMAMAPIVRSEQWRKAKDVAGLTVPTGVLEEKEYKGMDGKGVLHYCIGTGEYLDVLCIRKVRIASGLDETMPLPLWCLNLNGFVFDHLPFEHDLSGIALLTCGENCIDSGLRAPKTQKAPHNKWSRAVNNATSHCLIQWPNWTGIFDADGHQRNKSGEVVPHELGLSTPLEEFPRSPIVPLTKEWLNMNALDDALVDTEPDFLTGSPMLSSTSVAQTPFAALSNASTRGSAFPTPTVASSTTAYSPTISAIDSSTMRTTTSFAVSDIVDLEHINNPEEVSTPASEVASNVATAGSSTPATENDNPRKSTLTHKEVKT